MNMNCACLDECAPVVEKGRPNKEWLFWYSIDDSREFRLKLVLLPFNCRLSKWLCWRYFHQNFTWIGIERDGDSELQEEKKTKM